MVSVSELLHGKWYMSKGISGQVELTANQCGKTGGQRIEKCDHPLCFSKVYDVSGNRRNRVRQAIAFSVKRK